MSLGKREFGFWLHKVVLTPSLLTPLLFQLPVEKPPEFVPECNILSPLAPRFEVPAPNFVKMLGNRKMIHSKTSGLAPTDEAGCRRTWKLKLPHGSTL